MESYARNLSTHRAYSYQPLNGQKEIRVFVLEPAFETSEPLKGNLLHIPIGPSLPSYAALSYVWGEGNKTSLIETPNGVLLITSSLNLSLRDIRGKYHAQLVWADGICINQGDDEEKGHQVRLMSQIYSSAAIVYAHFGESNKTSDLGMRALLHIGTEASKGWPEHGLEPKPVWYGAEFPEKGGQQWLAIASFLQRPWFGRIWIVQEVLLAGKIRIVCGAYQMEWDAFFRAVYYCREAMSIHAEYPWRLGHERIMRADRGPARLLELVYRFGFAKASLARDRLFGLLGIAADGNDELYQVNYKCKLEDVVRDFGAAFVRKGQVRELLRFAGIDPHLNRFPSWIPDCTRDDLTTSLDTWNVGYRAAACTHVVACLNPEADTLTLNGWCIDEIIHVSDHYDIGEKGHLQFVSDLMAMEEPLQRYPSREELFLRVAIGDLQPHTNFQGLAKHLCQLELFQPTPQQFSHRDAHPVLAKSVSKESSDTSFPLQEPDENSSLASFVHMSSSFQAVFGTASEGPGRFCITRRGFIGFVRRITRPLDVVCIFSGLPVPFIIRKSEEKVGTYRLVGQAYIDGLMHGEVIDQNNECYLDKQKIQREREYSFALNLLSLRCFPQLQK